MADRRPRVNGSGFFADEIDIAGVTPGGVPPRQASPEELDLWEKRAVEIRSQTGGRVDPEYLVREVADQARLLAAHGED